MADHENDDADQRPAAANGGGPRQGGPRQGGPRQGGPRQGGPRRDAPRRDGPRRDGRQGERERGGQRAGRQQGRGAGGAPRAGGRRDDRGSREQGRDARRDDRRTDRAGRPERAEPRIPEEVTGHELDRQVRGELGTLSRENAKQVARHLVMVFQLLDDDPKAALEHAVAAQRRAGRVGLVREAAGIAAYRAGEYEHALRELRTARRLTGSQQQLPLMADCERGLGRPERALDLAAGPEVRQLDRAGQLEMLMVAAGARQDLGQPESAVVLLQVPELTRRGAPGHARLLSAYADALAAAGRQSEAEDWLRRAAAADTAGETGAASRLGLAGPDDDLITDLLEGDEDADGQGEETADTVDETVGGADGQHATEAPTDDRR